MRSGVLDYVVWSFECLSVHLLFGASWGLAFGVRIEGFTSFLLVLRGNQGAIMPPY